MKPIVFPEANAVFKSPTDMEGSCQEIVGYVGEIKSGVFDGSLQTIVAWKPTEEEILMLCAGQSIFLSVIGQLPPHYLSTSFEEARMI